MPCEGGRWAYRVSAVGQTDGLKVMQNFYLVAGPEGEQVVLAFTMTPAQAKKLGKKDQALADALQPTPGTPLGELMAMRQGKLN